MPTMQVVDFKREGWRDIVTTLRQIADGLESGYYEKVDVCAIVMLHEQPEVGAPVPASIFGLGPRAEALQTLAALTLGQQLMSDTVLGA